MRRINWGIMGAGTVAREFARGLKSLSQANLRAVSARTQESAQSFAKEFSVPHFYESNDRLVEDPDIDIVYIATPNTAHLENATCCLEANKAIILEKPFTINASQAREVANLAQKKKLFAMEAMWTRFMPLYSKLREMIERKVVGQIKTMTADFGIKIEFDENSRFYNPRLGGGALLDLGIYPISLSFFLFGPPSDIVSQATICKTGVDEQSFVVFRYPDGKQAALHSSFTADTPTEMTLVGTMGTIRVHPPIYSPSEFTLTKSAEKKIPSAVAKIPRLASLKQLDVLKKGYNRLSHMINPPQKEVIPYQSNGYQYEAAEAMSCLSQGKTESSIMPLDETCQIIETIDTIRAQWNFHYPNEHV